MSTTTHKSGFGTLLTNEAIASFSEFAKEHVGEGVTLEACVAEWRRLQGEPSLAIAAGEALTDFRSGRTVSSNEFHNQLQSLIESYDREADANA